MTPSTTIIGSTAISPPPGIRLLGNSWCKRTATRGSSNMQVLGVSAFYHDSAAAILRDGEILAAAQEERFTRKKFDAAFPRQAIAWCLDAAETSLKEITYVVFYDKPWLKFDRLLETYLSVAPRG